MSIGESTEMFRVDANVNLDFMQVAEQMRLNLFTLRNNSTAQFWYS